MATQIQIGKDRLIFSRVQNLANCEVTPTPTPTPACLTVNLHTEITCNEYKVVDSYQSSSSNKLLDAIVASDNSIVTCGLSVCGSVVNTSYISESTISKNKFNDITTENSEIKKAFVLDDTFSTNGKINKAFYNATNLKVPSKFSCMISQVASGQNKIIVGGDNDNKPLIARYLLSSGAEDRTFGFNTGAVTLDSVSNNTIRLINVFGLALQTDNKLVVFCNAYDTVNKHSLCVILRLTNSGNIDTAFNQNRGFIALRSLLPEFDGNRITGLKIKKYNDTIYLIFECFSSIKKNTIILAKYSLSDSSVDTSFGTEGFSYVNIEDKDTYYQNVFVYQSTIYVIANSQNKRLHIVPHTMNGAIDSSKQTLEISNQIFPISETNTNNAGLLTVNFLNLPCDEIIVDDNIIIPININILSNPINTLGAATNSGFHWFEKQSLAQVNVEYNAVQYRDCSILPCDMQPQDSYGTLAINKQKVEKYYTPSRILYGFISLSSDMTSATPIKLDRFDNLVPHNILKNILLLNNTYVAVGYSGDNFYTSLSFKTLDFVPDSSSLGPAEKDIVGSVNFNDSCKALFTEEFLVEECPCAPAATPTPTPTPVLPTSDVYITNIASQCRGDIPVLNITWAKNIDNLIGSYVLQVVRNSTDKPEILATSFDIDRATNSGDIVLELDQLSAELNNRTCIASIINNLGEVIHSKIFVLSINNCQQ